MVRTQREIAMHASRVHSRNARTRRWQLVIAQMRADGLAVDVWRDRPGGGSEPHPDYLPDAIRAATGR